MISVRAIYDGSTLKVLDDVEVTSPRQVIVTFLDDNDLAGFTMNRIAMEGGGLDFLAEEEEDIYTDEHLKIKYTP